MIKQFFKYIVIILVYKNADDLQECIKSFHKQIPNYKIIVVNAFYDEISKQQIEQIAQKNDCAFINVPNKGYSYGNNQGIDYAKRNYQFDYLIISNPDIIVKSFKENFPAGVNVFAPCITTLSGKHQNPMLIYNSRLSKYLIYQGFKHSNQCWLYLGILLNTIFRKCGNWVNLLQGKNAYPIYAAHGSFLLISYQVLEKISPLYDENMFLFSEECVLADKLYTQGFKTYYYPQIQILHKEDGSVKLSNVSMKKISAQSCIYYYEHYIKGK